MNARNVALVALTLILTACGNSQSGLLGKTSGSTVLDTFKATKVTAPADNPVTPAKTALGFRLWFEPRLSGNDKMSCATCHQHTKGFSNGEATAAGITGERGKRNTPTILTASKAMLLFWDGRAKSLEEQALGPIENPVEMNAKLEDVVRKLEAVPYYKQKFKEVFGTGVTAEGIAKALATFERAVNVSPSAFDRFLAGDDKALTPQQQRGFGVFISQGNCSACHVGADLTDFAFHNIGVGMKDEEPDLGRYLVTKIPSYEGSFKTPTLRNIAASAPYMHDGSLRTLRDVVDFYDRGGIPNPNKHPIIRPLGLSEANKTDLVAFLNSFSSQDNIRELAKLPGIRLPQEPIKEIPIPAELLIR